MLRTIREHLDEAGSVDDQSYLLTSALSAHESHLARVEFDVVQEYMDVVNVITYGMIYQHDDPDLPPHELVSLPAQ